MSTSTDFEVVIENRKPEQAEPKPNTENPAPEPNDVKMEDQEEDIGEVFPDHYYGDGKIPVFKPTMNQFKSFKHFIAKIDHYGMKSGIVKVVPPKEWIDSLPPLDDKVRDIKIKNPIVQHINGTTGVYRQMNMQKQKTYNLPQWRQVCESSEHQPPAKRGERRKNQAPPTTKNSRAPRTTRSTRRSTAPAEEEIQRPLTPPPGDDKSNLNTPIKPEADLTEDNGTPTPAKGRQPKSKRVYVKKTKEEMEEAAAAAEEIWNGFDYRISNNDEYTAERCEELEKHYWRTLTYNSPLYGADMPGSLFEDSTTVWNVAHLENILDCLGTKLPGVNTAYLYLGMWKSTFSWHLEDVDLYSINYIHFGAPKQWYSISQEDAPRFYNAMKSIWPGDAKKCDQFLRHKTFLASPSVLQSQYNIKVNKLVHYQGEFVITFPFGYHAGYNVGYNCAESVNFATEAWLDYGRKAKKCDCIDDAVWVDANEIERKMNGWPTESEEEYEDEEEEEDEDDEPNDLPTPPESVGEGEVVKKPRKPAAPRKRKPEADGDRTIKKLKLKVSKPPQKVCVLCPHNPKHEELLSTDNGKKAHRICAMYIPETYFKIDEETGEEIICNIAAVPKARTDLKCNFCRFKQGACFQCFEKKCYRAYHATCAAAAGVLAQSVLATPPPEEPAKESTENTEDKEPKGPTAPPDTEIELRCRFHRPKRPKDHDTWKLEEIPAIREFAQKVTPGDIIQMQYVKGDIFAGRVVENRNSEETIVVEVLPENTVFEVEYKYVLCAAGLKTSPVPKPVRSKASESNPSSRKRMAVARKTADFYADEPLVGDQLFPEDTKFQWAEFNLLKDVVNPHQEPAIKIWYYLGQLSSENIPAWTKDLVNEPWANKKALEPHLQRRNGHSDIGPHYPTQAEEAHQEQLDRQAQQKQERAVAWQQQQQQQQIRQQPQPLTPATNGVPQPQYTTNWKMAPAPAGPVAPPPPVQQFRVATAAPTAASAGRKRVFYMAVNPSPPSFQTFQSQPTRVALQPQGKKNAANPAPKPAAGTAQMAPAPNPRPAPNGAPVAIAPPNVAIKPAPLSGATPS